MEKENHKGSSPPEQLSFLFEFSEESDIFVDQRNVVLLNDFRRDKAVASRQAVLEKLLSHAASLTW